MATFRIRTPEGAAFDYKSQATALAVLDALFPQLRTGIYRVTRLGADVFLCEHGRLPTPAELEERRRQVEEVEAMLNASVRRVKPGEADPPF